MIFSNIQFECDKLANRKLTDITKIQTQKYNVKELYKTRPSYNTHNICLD